MKKIISGTLLVLSAALAPAHAQDTATSDRQLVSNVVDSLFHGSKGFDHSNAFAGAEIGITWKDSVYFFSYGYSDIERQLTPDARTLFEIGSNTKLFTGLLLAREMEKGSISAHTVIDEFLPVNKHIAGKVRVLDLATFTSGLPTLHDSESMAALEAMNSVEPMALVDNNYLLSMLAHTDSLHSYGTYEYSNYSYSLLGYLLSRINCKSYGNLLARYVLKPLELHNTAVQSDTDNTILARGYEDGKRVPFLRLTGMAPAGILKSDASDMVHFLRYQLGKPCPLSDEIALSQQKFYTDEALQLSMGLCWHITPLYDHDLYVMRGDTYGFSSLLAFDKSEQLGVVILTNTLNSEEMERSFHRIYKKIMESRPEFKRELSKPVVQLSPDILKRYEGSYEVSPEFVMNIFVDSGKLFVQCTGQPRGQIDPVSETLFTARKYGAKFEFVKAGDTYAKVILRQNGRVITANRKS